jgi:hypothetical protein
MEIRFTVIKYRRNTSTASYCSAMDIRFALVKPVTMKVPRRTERGNKSAAPIFASTMKFIPTQRRWPQQAKQNA